MSYGEESWINLPITVHGNVYSTDWGAGGAKMDDMTGGEFISQHVVGYSKCTLKRVGVLVTTAAAGATTTPVVKVFKGSIASGTLLATLTLGTTEAGLAVYYDPTTNVELNAGDYITFELDVADVGSGKASEGFPFALVEPNYEIAANQTADLVLTA